MTPSEPKGDVDFFISYRGSRTEWAEWIVWVVRSQGFTTMWMKEFKIGRTWPKQIRDAAARCRRLIPLLHADYWNSGPCEMEFDTYWRLQMGNKAAQFLLPFELESYHAPNSISGIVAQRLSGLDRDAAHAAILSVLQDFTPVAPRTTPFTDPEPPFPGVVKAPAFSVPIFTKPLPVDPIPVDRKGFINCDLAFEVFEGMLTQTAIKRILLVQGHGKHGKSTLINLFFHHSRALLGSESTIRVEFKKAGSPPEEHLQSMARVLKVQPPSDGNFIQRLDSLLDACGERPVVFLFDAYEHAEYQHQHWVNRVLERCLDDSHFRCVVAGRELPPAASQPWGLVAQMEECDAMKQKAALIAHACAKGYSGKPEHIEGLIECFIRLRDREIQKGNHEHTVNCEVLLEELDAISRGGGTWV